MRPLRWAAKKMEGWLFKMKKWKGEKKFYWDNTRIHINKTHTHTNIVSHTIEWERVDSVHENDRIVSNQHLDHLSVTWLCLNEPDMQLKVRFHPPKWDSKVPRQKMSHGRYLRHPMLQHLRYVELDLQNWWIKWSVGGGAWGNFKRIVIEKPELIL